MMSKNVLAVVVTSVLLGVGPAAFAAAGGGHGAGHAGGNSATHMSSGGLLKTNGPDAVDRDKGRERAGDRMSLKGATHTKAGLAHHHKHHKPAKPVDLK